MLPRGAPAVAGLAAGAAATAALAWGALGAGCTAATGAVLASHLPAQVGVVGVATGLIVSLIMLFFFVSMVAD
ncbi:exported hypothetical protein [Verrucomicrobia bacterium]|nr:exported hypothetical protein [Verrucomicrobiota bacterium]